MEIAHIVAHYFFLVLSSILVAWLSHRQLLGHIRTVLRGSVFGGYIVCRSLVEFTKLITQRLEAVVSAQISCSDSRHWKGENSVQCFSHEFAPSGPYFHSKSCFLNESNFWRRTFFAAHYCVHERGKWFLYRFFFFHFWNNLHLMLLAVIRIPFLACARAIHHPYLITILLGSEIFCFYLRYVVALLMENFSHNDSMFVKREPVCCVWRWEWSLEATKSGIVQSLALRSVAQS